MVVARGAANAAMPEGDTLYRIAATLRPALESNIVALTLPRVPFHETGMAVQTVQAFGKHLLLQLADGRLLHTHLKMTGIWHLYKAHCAWNRAARDAVVVVATEAAVAVCFRAPTVQLLAPLAARRLVASLRVAQDILDPTFDGIAAATALQVYPTSPIGVALLNQSIIAGIGNVYKSEGLFAARIHPATLISEIANERLFLLVDLIANMMRRNVSARAAGAQPHYQYQRTTRSGCEIGKGPIAVYGRQHRSCFECGADIQMLRQGEQQRSSYFCPGCQPSL
jgi:endonuclease VIII